MSLELTKTQDGSDTLKNTLLKDSYHSKYGAINESQHVFINNGLKRINRNPCKLLEVGFGTGLNALLTKLHSEKNKIKIVYHAIENFPVPYDIYSNLNYSNQLKIDNKQFLRIHDLSWEEETKLSEFFTIKKINFDFNKINFEEKYDLIYFDAFSPSKQTEMWSEKNFKKLYECLNSDAILITYCAKGIVKRTLKKVGFNIFPLSGPTGKREITLACKN